MTTHYRCYAGGGIHTIISLPKVPYGHFSTSSESPCKASASLRAFSRTARSFLCWKPAELSHSSPKSIDARKITPTRDRLETGLCGGHIKGMMMFSFHRRFLPGAGNLL